MSSVPATPQFCPCSTKAAIEINKWVWLFASKTLFRQTGGRPGLLSPALERTLSECSCIGSTFPRDNPASCRMVRVVLAEPEYVYCLRNQSPWRMWQWGSSRSGRCWMTLGGICADTCCWTTAGPWPPGVRLVLLRSFLYANAF